MTRALSVWWDGRVAGVLQLTATGSITFAYTSEWLNDQAAPAISLSLPKRVQLFRDRECRPFFSGLLPESGQRDIVAAALGLSKHNDFALLDALGGEVAGALTLWPEGDEPPDGPDATPEVLSDRELIAIIDALPGRPLLAGSELRLSLAGAQPKVPVVVDDGRIALPARGQPTTHILKPAIERFTATPENEALVMKLAQAVGLDVAVAELRAVAEDPRHRFLLVTRYDRRVDEGGRLRRLHQEDVCQALAVAPERKYEREGGPGFSQCFDLVRRAATRPAVDVLKLVDAAIFNVIAGNADAHGKNFSLLYADGEVRLAPLYDLLCTVAYPDLSPKFAMKIGRRATLEEMGVKAWATFAAAVGVGAPYVGRRMKEMSLVVQERLPAVVKQFAPPFDLQAMQRIADLIAARAERVATRTTG